VKRVVARAELRAAVAEARAAGRRIGFVPTMGYLHDGHLQLIDVARRSSDFIVLSVFVNPLQFGPAEDYARYPRDLERDAQLAEERGADLLYAPATSEMYPAGDPAVSVVAPALSQRLDGAYRPGHFQGVLTVVAKLLHQVQPDVAVFGQKDFQQLVLVRRMVRDLDFHTTIDAAPIVRDPDGLALSSRNVYLSSEERQDALLLNRALAAAAARFQDGETAADPLIATAREVLERGARVGVQYIELVDPGTLESVQRATNESVLMIAAFVGVTRLIDNRILGSSE
jgi:pantoate--beta-alanine ligase